MCVHTIVVNYVIYVMKRKTSYMSEKRRKLLWLFMSYGLYDRFKAHIHVPEIPSLKKTWQFTYGKELWSAKCYLPFFVYKIAFCLTKFSFAYRIEFMFSTKLNFELNVDKINSVSDEIQFRLQNRFRPRQN